jgi:hypothetical protein
VGRKSGLKVMRETALSTNEGKYNPAALPLPISYSAGLSYD